MTPRSQTSTCDASSDASVSLPLKELHIAPMLDVSYTEFRYLMRLLTKHAVLWTEMVVDETLVYSDSPEPHLEFDPAEHPVVCQLGGNHDDWMKNAVELVHQYGYDEVNLNAGCPSNKVAGQKAFGSALMQDADVAVRMLQVMRAAAADNDSSMNVSIKTRIGVDKDDDYDEFLRPFIERLVNEGGCQRIFLHARKVLTHGIRPAQNRTIPPLDYSKVYRLCRDFPGCDFWVNGGVHTLEQAKLICYGSSDTETSWDGAKSPLHAEQQGILPRHGQIPCLLCKQPHGSCIAPPVVSPPNLRGCMMGRAAMDNPASFGNADRLFFGADCNPSLNRRHVLEQYCEFIERQYPRRCCDSDPRVTVRFPSPSFVEDPSACCRICGHGVSADETDDSDGDDGVPLLPIRMSPRILGLTLKPITGMFHGLTGAKTWRRACAELPRDSSIRNCGPAFCIRRAMLRMSDDLLDLPFADANS